MKHIGKCGKHIGQHQKISETIRNAQETLQQHVRKYMKMCGK